MPSIKRDIYLFLFGLAFGLTAVYSLLMSQSYDVGIKEAELYAFNYEIASIEQAYKKTGKLPPLPAGETLQTYIDISQIPVQYRDEFNWNTMASGEIYEGQIISNEDIFYLYGIKYQIPNSDIVLYFISQYSGNLLQQIFEKNPPEYTQNNIIGIAAGVLVLIVFFMVRLLVYRLTKPVFQLSNWAKNLHESGAPPPKTLQYLELNLLANQLSNSLNKQREAVEREEFFLRAASHEMRTPITIISASTEMLNRVSEQAPNSTKRAIDRISRSVSNMQDMMTALLWLARENTQHLATKPILLRPLLEEIVDEHQHLINDKLITLSIHEPSPITLDHEVPELTKIVMVNLFRNAIQHTEEGEIKIDLMPSTISISNPYSLSSHQESTSNINTMSFGIGLFLVEKICKKQRWVFEHIQNSSSFTALVKFN